MKAITLTIKCDNTALLKLVDQLRGDINASENADLKQVFKALLGFPNFLKELISIQSNNGSARAGELLVFFNPSDLFLRIAVAIGAGDVDALVVEHKRILSEVQLSSEDNGKVKEGVTG